MAVASCVTDAYAAIANGTATLNVTAQITPENLKKYCNTITNITGTGTTYTLTAPSGTYTATLSVSSTSASVTSVTPAP